MVEFLNMPILDFHAIFFLVLYYFWSDPDDLIGSDQKGSDSAGSAPLLAEDLRVLTLEQDSVLAGGSPQRQLVEGDDLTAGLQNTLASLLGHAQGADRHLGNLEDPTNLHHAYCIGRVEYATGSRVVDP